MPTKHGFRTVKWSQQSFLFSGNGKESMGIRGLWASVLFMMMDVSIPILFLSSLNSGRKQGRCKKDDSNFRDGHPSLILSFVLMERNRGIAGFFRSASAFLNLLLATLKIVSEYYPGRLHKAFVIDPPSLFSCLWKVLQ